jgi:hypothetical protein
MLKLVVSDDILNTRIIVMGTTVMSTSMFLPLLGVMSLTFVACIGATVYFTLKRVKQLEHSNIK